MVLKQTRREGERIIAGRDSTEEKKISDVKREDVSRVPFRSEMRN